MYENALVQDARLDETQQELLNITWRMLNAIHLGDAEIYGSLCTNDLSCFEDVCQYRIDGLEFHLDLIRQMSQNPALKPARFDILSPRIQVYGDQTGIVTYTRLMTYDEGGKPRWSTFNETRIFIKQGGAWKMAHFHRSPT
jgi:ketosteroid isomerase-like protein